MAANEDTWSERSGRRSSSEVRRLILDAARIEFTRHGYGGTGSRDIARAAGVAISALYRHFDSKAELFSAAMLEPFVEAFERLGNDWVRQLGEPLGDDELMQMFLRDIYSHLAEHQHALNQLILGHSELDSDIIERLRDVFAQLFARQTVMTQLEVTRRPWMSDEGIDVSLRLLMCMMLGVSTYAWMVLPGGEDEAKSKKLLAAMARFGMWGMATPTVDTDTDTDTGKRRRAR